ncbi:hypothetical protein T11_6424 [Trichinella zimbabwensis]|uniref:Uncharacterized protein n=1 Tax=Trichinella zimbabwensis TaxID=268475 RepID=A0A0V1HDZ4_9BILA|nr:hypothetical protein T11_6424 [Trichinella zimbabwensis]
MKQAMDMCNNFLKAGSFTSANCQFCSLNGKMNKQVEVDLKSLNRKIVHNTNFSYRVMILKKKCNKTSI